MTNLTDLIPVLQREVNPPGSDLFPDATDQDWLGYIKDGAAEARLDGFLAAYTFDYTAATATPDLPDYYQYLICLWAGVRVTRTRISNLQTSVKQQAGPVAQEIQVSSQMLRDVLDEIRSKKNRIVELSYHITSIALIDAAIQRDFNDLSFLRPNLS